MTVDERFATIARSMGNPNRVKILWLLIQAEHSVDALTSKTDISFANVSQHLQTMRSNGMVESRRDQNRVIYRISDQSVIDMLVATQNVARVHFADVNAKVYTDSEGRPVQTIHPQEAWDWLRGDEAVIIDVRPLEEFDAGHIPGALSLPSEKANIADIERLRLQEPLIVYGRHAFCSLPDRVIELLKQKEWNPYRLEGGIPEWLFGGWPVARH